MANKKPFQKSRLWLYAIIILLCAYFFTKNTLDILLLQSISWTGRIGVAILLALAMLLIRDLGYVLRLRLLTDYKISFWKTVRIILLWEFGSAITPGMIGGKAVAVYLLIKNKIHAAKASSMVLLCIILDEFIFILIFPVLYLFIGSKMLHGNTDCPDWIALKSKIPLIDNIKYIEYTIWIMLGLIMTFVIIAFIGIFLHPMYLRSIIYKLSKIPILNRWKGSIQEFADELIETSRQIKSKSKTFWIQLLSYTLMSWVGRYLVGVAIVWGFANVHFDFVTAYTKQYALWLMFYLPSTPGSTGIAEALYMAFYCEYIQAGMSGTAAFLWRLMSYYIYLIFGFLLLFTGKENIVEEDAE